MQTKYTRNNSKNEQKTYNTIMTKTTTDERCKTVFDFLKELANHNDRSWFMAHRPLYDAAREAFLMITTDMIARISEFDPEVSHLSATECTYRIYRDVRFSNDKRPYKQHMGAFINARGRKSPHGGYYLHLEPGKCILAGGSICITPQILKAIRQSIFDNTDEFRGIVENPAFSSLFKEIGEERLKTVPQGFPKDYPYMQYLRPKDYSISTDVPDSLFLSDGWAERCAEVFEIMKPYLDFINYTVDDYI